MKLLSDYSIKISQKAGAKANTNLCAMNSRELIRQLTPLHGAGEARAIVRVMMEERFHLSQTDLLLGRDSDLSPQEQEAFVVLAARLLTGEPIQYVLGYTSFCGHRFRVTPDVLIPRPETEELVQWAIEKLRVEGLGLRDDTAQPSLNPKPSTLNCLDLCTGSGCIAISWALAFPEAQVTAVDISLAALGVARQNAIDLGAGNVSFLQADILNSQFSNFNSQFSILISNPPYVCNAEARDMSPTVLQHEPGIALFVPDEDPLCFYRAIADSGRRVLRPGGLVLVELNAALAEQTLQLFCDRGYTALQLRADQFGRTRFLAARCSRHYAKEPF